MSIMTVLEEAKKRKLLPSDAVTAVCMGIAFSTSELVRQMYSGKDQAAVKMGLLNTIDDFHQTQPDRVGLQ